jgi:hypothetical protein
MTVDDFINQTNNTHIDEDGYYGAQCWDLVARYARVVVGCPSFPTGSGGAEGLFRIFADPIPQYFDRIANNPSDPNQLPQKGDVIVWQASFSPPYGHTALVISANSAGVTVLEQNGNNPGGNAYIKQRGWVGISGWLRPKVKEQVSMPSKAEVVSAFATYGVPGPSDDQETYYSTRPWNTLVQDLFSYVFDQKKADDGVIADLNSKLSDLQSKFDELLKTDQLKDQRIADLQKQVPGSTEVPQPVIPTGKSLWQVIADFFSQFKKG